MAGTSTGQTIHLQMARLKSFRSSLEKAPAGLSASPLWGSVSRWVSPGFESITKFGRIAIVAFVTSWVMGVLLGWQELLLVAATLLVALVIGIFFLVGRLWLKVQVRMESQRCAVGEQVPVEVRYRNGSRVRSRPVTLDIPVGASTASFRLGSLASGESGEVAFIISKTLHRGVIKVGPATVTRGDPLGLFWRDRPVEGVLELLVHPRSIRLGPLGGGLLRDLEGITTSEMSPSELAFHSLREYVVGDDRRFIHWRSSARVGGLQVRQFLDSRRSSVMIVLDETTDHYQGPDEFELACEVAASLALRAFQDGLPCSLVTDKELATTTVPVRILDALARVELTRSSLGLDLLKEKRIRCTVIRQRSYGLTKLSNAR